MPPLPITTRTLRAMDAMVCLTFAIRKENVDRSWEMSREMREKSLD